MGVVEVLPAIELISGLERALLFLVEDVLHVHELALAEVEVDAGPEELFGQHGDVEFQGVVAGDVAALHQPGQ